MKKRDFITIKQEPIDVKPPKLENPLKNFVDGISVKKEKFERKIVENFEEQEMEELLEIQEEMDGLVLPLGSSMAMHIEHELKLMKLKEKAEKLERKEQKKFDKDARKTERLERIERNRLAQIELARLRKISKMKSAKRKEEIYRAQCGRQLAISERMRQERIAKFGKSGEKIFVTRSRRNKEEKESFEIKVKEEKVKKRKVVKESEHLLTCDKCGRCFRSKTGEIKSFEGPLKTSFKRALKLLKNLL